MANKTIINSAVDLKMAFGRLEPDIRRPETEETWDKILKAISSLLALCHNGACEYPQELTQHIRSLSSPLTSSMLSERTRLSGAAVDLMSAIASGLGSKFEPLVPIFLPPLLTLSGRTTKVFVTRAKSCITTIVETTQLPSILPYFLNSIKDKSNSIRLASAEGSLACLNCLNPPDLEKDARVRDIESIIKATATDPQADIRRVGKKLFDAYKVLFPSRIDIFTDPLTPTIKKYLDIKSASLLKHEPLPRLMPVEAKKLLSSSTSSAIGRGRPPKHQPPAHIRSTSTSALSDSTKSTGTLDQGARAEAKKLKTDMPPPPFVPIRTVRSQTDLPRAIPGKSSGPSRQPQPTLAKEPSSSTSRTLPHRPPRLPSKDGPEGTVAQPKSLPQRTGFPPSSTPASDTRDTGQGTVTINGAERVVPPKAPSRPVEKSSKPVIAKVTKKPQPPAPSKEPKTRSLTQPTLAQLSRAAAVAKEKNAPTRALPDRRPQHPAKSSLNSSTSAPSRTVQPGKIPLSRPKERGEGRTPPEIPLPPSPEPADIVLSQASVVVVAMTEDASTNALTRSNQSASEDSDSRPTALDVRDVQRPGPETVAEVPVNVSMVAHTLGGDDNGSLVEKTEPEPGTPVRSVPSDNLANLSTKTPISALLSSIQQGFLLSPSEPLSPPQSYLEHKMPAPSALRAVKGPFIFGKRDDEEARGVLDSMENVMNAQA